MAKTIKITQTRSAIGRLPKHKATLLGLGLRRIGHTVEREGKGTRWRETRNIYGKEAIEEMEITDFQPNKRYTVEANTHGTLYITVFKFTAVKGGTKVTIEFEGFDTAIEERKHA
jgi:large subunit ribosomal protein L30